MPVHSAEKYDAHILRNKEISHDPHYQCYGHIGKELTPLLLEAGQSVRVLVRDEHKVAHLDACVQSGVTGFIWATTGVLAAGYVQEHEQGQLAGVNVALSGLMSMLGSLWAGAVYDGISLNLPYWIGSLVLLIACVLLARVKVRAQTRSSSQRNVFSTAD